ncbi:MAG: hypothetical protein M1831_005002 [Alyxoria varia]|nr:MAG: hypothetical protein M1831_005002 [Alyxoria varia]
MEEEGTSGSSTPEDLEALKRQLRERALASQGGPGVPQQPATEQQVPAQKMPEQPAPEQPAPEQPTPEQQMPEQPGTEQEVPAQQMTEQPATEQQVPAQPVIEQQAPAQQTPEQPESEQQTREQPATGQQAPAQKSPEPSAPMMTDTTKLGLNSYTSEPDRFGGPRLQPLPLLTKLASSEARKWFRESEEKLLNLAASLKLRCNSINVAWRIPAQFSVPPGDATRKYTFGDKTILVEAFLHPDGNMAYCEFVDGALEMAESAGLNDLHVEIILKKPSEYLSSLEPGHPIWEDWKQIQRWIVQCFVAPEITRKRVPGVVLKSARLGRLCSWPEQPPVIVITVNKALRKEFKARINQRMRIVPEDASIGDYKAFVLFEEE